MLTFHGVLAVLFPSVPPRDQAVVLAAMEGRDLETPVPERLGEVRDGAGQPEGGDRRLSSFGRSPSSGPPSCERRQSAPVHPALRHQLEDHHLVRLLTQWGATS